MKKIKIKSAVYNRGTEDKTGVKFNMWTDLTAFKKIQFVKGVTNVVVDENYNSVIRDMMFDYMIIQIFTDVDTTDIEDYNNHYDYVENLLDETNIVEIVKANVTKGLIDELNEAVDKNIEFKTGIHPNLLRDGLAKLLSVLEEKIVDTDTNSLSTIANVFSNIKGEITAESLSRGMIDSYLKSDAFLKNEEKRQKIADERAKNKVNNQVVSINKETEELDNIDETEAIE